MTPPPRQEIDDLAALTPGEIKQKDLEYLRGTETWNEAVSDLERRLKEEGEWESLVELIKSNDGSFPMSHHLMGGGMYIRNVLRDLGYGEEEIGIVNLDNVYVEIVEEAYEDVGT